MQVVIAARVVCNTPRSAAFDRRDVDVAIVRGQIYRLPVGSPSSRQPEARRTIRRPVAVTLMARSIRPMVPGCISTPRSSPDAPVTPH